MPRSAGIKSSRLSDKLGMPPEAFRGGLYDPEDGILDEQRARYVVQPGPGSKGKRTSANNTKSGFSLRGVIEVLEEFGLDPVVEIAKALKEGVPVTDRSGNPVLDAKGNQLMKPALDISDRVRVNQSLVEYVHPKLKSVEMTVKKPELTDDQVEQRLAALLLQAQKTAGAGQTPPTHPL